MATTAFTFLGDSATHPIEPLRLRQGVLFRLAGSSLLRRRAYPDTPATAYSGAFNCGFQGDSRQRM